VTSAGEKSADVDTVIADASRDRRLCPQPMACPQSCKRLPEGSRSGPGQRPGSPLILAVCTPQQPTEKQARFHEHIRWAAEHGALSMAADFVAGLGAEDWYRGD